MIIDGNSMKNYFFLKKSNSFAVEACVAEPIARFAMLKMHTVTDSQAAA